MSEHKDKFLLNINMYRIYRVVLLVNTRKNRERKGRWGRERLWSFNSVNMSIKLSKCLHRIIIHVREEGIEKEKKKSEINVLP